MDAAALRVALLTGGHDATYAHGLTRALACQGIQVDVIGSDAIDAPWLHGSDAVQFLNLRGDQGEHASVSAKVLRVSRYYLRLIRYAIRSDAPVFHILWNNRLETFDRTVLMWIYKACRRRIVITAHNVNAARRDGRDTWLNRATLRLQYAAADHVFVHTEKMRTELQADFGVSADKISVIPFGINDESPQTGMSEGEARRRLGVSEDARVALLFGQVAAYKGVEYAVLALRDLCRDVPAVKLIIAGRVKRGEEAYWRKVSEEIEAGGLGAYVMTRIEHIPEQDLEIYFKAADVLVMPYVEIFQSGLPFLAYAFGLPVVCTDAGSLAEDVVPGVTGYVCRRQDAGDLARALVQYFGSPLYENLTSRRKHIRELALEKYSWRRVAESSCRVYESVLRT